MTNRSSNVTLNLFQGQQNKAAIIPLKINRTLASNTLPQTTLLGHALMDALMLSSSASC